MKEKYENWVDALLEQPENHHEQQDGSMLYGCGASLDLLADILPAANCLIGDLIRNNDW